MATIIRKSKKESNSEPSRYPVQKAIGWQKQVSSKIWSPPTDMYERDDAYLVRMEIAGMREADFTVSVEGEFLVISGSRPDLQERCAYHQMEIRCGKFTSAVSLPDLVDLENASAEYQDGFFVVILPKLKSDSVSAKEK